MKKKIKTYQIIMLEIIGIVILYVVSQMTITSELSRCWIFENTGILCPSCGGTRCVQSLFNGNIIKAFEYHFVFTIGIIYLLALNIVFLINKNRANKILTWMYPKIIHLVIFVVVLVTYTIMRNL